MQPPCLVELQKCLGKAVGLGGLTVLQLWHSKEYSDQVVQSPASKWKLKIFGDITVWISIMILSALESPIVQTNFLSIRLFNIIWQLFQYYLICILQNKGDQIVAHGAMYGLLEQVTWSRACSSDYVSQEPPWSQFWVAPIASMRSNPHFWLVSFSVSHGTLPIIKHSSKFRSSQAKTWLGVGSHCQNNWHGFQLDS